MFAKSLTFKGKVKDKNTKRAIVKVRIDVCYTQVRLRRNHLACKAKLENFNQNEAIAYLFKNSIFDVLEVKRNYPDVATDYAKIRMEETGVLPKEGWIIIRTNRVHYAELFEHRLENVAHTDAEGYFSFQSPKNLPQKLKFVKPPHPKDINGWGYFDEESIWLSQSELHLIIEMEAANYMIEESDMIGLLKDWKGYRYAEDHLPKYPPHYLLNNLVSSKNQAKRKQITACTFIEALLTQAWHQKYHNVALTQEEHQQLVGPLAPFHWYPTNEEDLKQETFFGLISISIKKKFALPPPNIPNQPPKSQTYIEKKKQWYISQLWFQRQATTTSKSKMDALSKEMERESFFIVDVHSSTGRKLILEASKKLDIEGVCLRDLDSLKSKNNNLIIEKTAKAIISPNKTSSWVQKIDSINAQKPSLKKTIAVRSARLKICNLKWSAAAVL